MFDCAEVYLSFPLGKKLNLDKDRRRGEDRERRKEKKREKLTVKIVQGKHRQKKILAPSVLSAEH